MILFSLFCVCFALIPEMVMYGTYSLIEPTSTLEKLATIALFWFGGGGLCFLFAILSFYLWVFGADIIAKGK